MCMIAVSLLSQSCQQSICGNRDSGLVGRHFSLSLTPSHSSLPLHTLLPLPRLLCISPVSPTSPASLTLRSHLPLHSLAAKDPLPSAVLLFTHTSDTMLRFFFNILIHSCINHQQNCVRAENSIINLQCINSMHKQYGSKN